MEYDYKGPEGDVSRVSYHDLFLFKHARRSCKLAPGQVMIAAHLPLQCHRPSQTPSQPQREGAAEKTIAAKEAAKL